MLAEVHAGHEHLLRPGGNPASWWSLAGQPVKTFRDVTCDPTDGALYAVCQEPLARLAFQRGRTISRIVGSRAGQRETVAVFEIVPPG